VTGYRASFDATVRFSKSGPTAHGFGVDVPCPGMDEDDIAALFMAFPGLLMSASVTLAMSGSLPDRASETRGSSSDPGRRQPLAGGGRSDSAMLSAPGWSPMLGFPARGSRRT
jgi:hypothetical protein